MRTRKTFYLLLAFALPGLYSCQSSLCEAEEGLPGLALQLAAVGAPDDIVYVGGDTRPVRQDLYRVTSLDARRYAELERPGERYEITPVAERYILLPRHHRADPQRRRLQVGGAGGQCAAYDSSHGHHTPPYPNKMGTTPSMESKTSGGFTDS